MRSFTEHNGHGRWAQNGKCVYCPCGERLYQGSRPRTPDAQTKTAEAMDELYSAIQKRSEAQP